MLKLEERNKLARLKVLWLRKQESQKELWWRKQENQKEPWWRKQESQKVLWWRKLVAQRIHQLRGKGLVRMEIRVVKLVEALRVDLSRHLLMKRLKD